MEKSEEKRVREGKKCLIHTKEFDIVQGHIYTLENDFCRLKNRHNQFHNIRYCQHIHKSLKHTGLHDHKVDGQEKIHPS
jgi:hypothetical protein